MTPTRSAYSRATGQALLRSKGLQPLRLSAGWTGCLGDLRVMMVNWRTNRESGAIPQMTTQPVDFGRLRADHLCRLPTGRLTGSQHRNPRTGFRSSMR